MVLALALLFLAVCGFSTVAKPGLQHDEMLYINAALGGKWSWREFIVVSLLIMLNAAHHGVDFTVPPGGSGTWEAVLDTAEHLQGERRATGESVIADARSLIVWEARA